MWTTHWRCGSISSTDKRRSAGVCPLVFIDRRMTQHTRVNHEKGDREKNHNDIVTNNENVRRGILVVAF